MNTNIEISEDDFHEILSIIGYPLINISDLEYSEEDIKKLFILPALREYYKWFPIEDDQIYSVSGQFELDFPDDYTFGAVDIRLVTQPLGATKVSNPFFNELFYHRSSSSRGYYGTRNNYGMTETRFIRRMERQSFINNGKTFRVKVDRSKRKVIGYTTMMGNVSVSWAKFSPVYDEVNYSFIDDVKKLSQANLLEGLVMIRGQQASNLDVEFNVDLFEKKAEDLKEEVLTRFKEHTKVVLLRG